jgi:hypothetical protein
VKEQGNCAFFSVNGLGVNPFDLHAFVRVRDRIGGPADGWLFRAATVRERTKREGRFLTGAALTRTRPA